jgi:predicted nucleic acid-binding protein
MESKANREVFADTCYRIALINPGDDFHEAAINIAPQIKGAIIVTSDWVLNEFLTFFNRFTPLKRKALEIYDKIVADPNVIVEPTSRKSFSEAVEKYRAEIKRSYSIVDCTSFNIIRARGIKDALSADRHFTQEGINALLSP